MDMNASKCEHRKMKRSEVGDLIKDSCPDCGFSASSTREEVAEFTNEVMDDVESKSK
jgi:hypothetical protein